MHFTYFKYHISTIIMFIFAFLNGLFSNLLKFKQFDMLYKNNFPKIKFVKAVKEVETFEKQDQS